MGNSKLLKGVGYAQISSVVFATGASLVPYLNNWLYKPRNGQLLPISYGDSEIAIQSHLAALAGIIINKDDILTKSTSLDLKKYSRQIMHFMLSHYKNELTALCASITAETQNHLLLK